ncbi:hypothetical protein V1J52_15665 [Streptomyces sp. TRM 70351]|uniref:hypothetical protein n=1 Tax=Streptomyces sp. TRM 70351 TaxID=3116552 RepID=UPI002E7BE7AC|nr:hypothetical protein [Streptomyces sp. TRM 70351]MEE1929604.1 hypothetical protein [Streptomyces sp. TRM 70351]
MRIRTAVAATALAMVGLVAGAGAASACGAHDGPHGGGYDDRPHHSVAQMALTAHCNSVAIGSSGNVAPFSGPVCINF